MLERLRETAPVALVPAAWTVATAAHLGVVTTRTLLIAHVVMDVVLVAFTVLSWADMATGALRTWRRVLVVGLLVTLAGTAGLAARPPDDRLLAVAILGWMVLPAVGLVDTGRRVASPRPYLLGGGVSAVGAAVYAAGLAIGPPATLAGLVLVGAGQTLGIAVAVAGG